MKFLYILLFLVSALNADPDFSCRQAGELAPEWTCNMSKIGYVAQVGVGDSLKHAKRAAHKTLAKQAHRKNKDFGLKINKLLRKAKLLESWKNPSTHDYYVLIGIDDSEYNKLLKSIQNQTYSLSILTQRNAKIEVLNIKQKYKYGIKLPKGTYKIKISKKGYKPLYETITLDSNTKIVRKSLTKNVIAKSKIVDSSKNDIIFEKKGFFSFHDSSVKKISLAEFITDFYDKKTTISLIEEKDKIKFDSKNGDGSVAHLSFVIDMPVKNFAIVGRKFYFGYYDYRVIAFFNHTQNIQSIDDIFYFSTAYTYNHSTIYESFSLIVEDKQGRFYIKHLNLIQPEYSSENKSSLRPSIQNIKAEKINIQKKNILAKVKYKNGTVIVKLKPAMRKESSIRHIKVLSHEKIMYEMYMIQAPIAMVKFSLKGLSKSDTLQFILTDMEGNRYSDIKKIK